MKRVLPVVLLLCAAAGGVTRAVPPGPALPSPESVLGFRPGEDGKLADWPQVGTFFRALAKASPRVRVEEVGKTTEGRPFLVVTVTSAANMARLEAIRRDNLTLADPRGVPEDELARIVARGKAVVVMNYSIHSTEVGGTLSAMVFAHRLAAAREPRTLEILDQTVLLMVPSHNPDGTDIVTAWQREQAGTPFAQSEPPRLYHHYAGHDNNRDWYMFTQEETRLTVRQVYDRWRPQIVHDVHQMRTNGPRLFVPPYLDPWDPNVDPALRAAAAAIGQDVAARLTGAGKAGVVVGALFDAWTPARAYPHTHGGVRVLTETASASLAEPLDLPASNLRPATGYDPRVASWNHPLPWSGGTWRLADIVEYQVAASEAILGHAARNRDFWLRTALDTNRRQIARTDPYAFLVPAGQDDPWATAELLRVLRTGGVEIEELRSPFATNRREYPAGSWVVRMQQPYSGFAKTVLERQRYPDLRDAAGKPLRPYDVTAHTLPLLLGVEVVAVEGSPRWHLGPAATFVPEGRVVGNGPALAFGHKNGDLVALGRLLREHTEVRWAQEPFADAGRSFPAGTLVAPASARTTLERAAAELGIAVRAIGDLPPGLRLRRAPRVGLYQSWVPSMDEGWTRFVFEKQAGVDYVTVHDADVRAGGLRERFDAIVLPSQSTAAILNGHSRSEMPEPYVGGLGVEGVQALRAFVESGGTLVALDAACHFAIDRIGLPVVDALERPSADAGEFYCPGALLEVTVDPRSPLGHGLSEKTAIWFESSPAFEPRGGVAIARYSTDAPLLSGWLLGGARLKGQAALLEVPKGQGRVVLFAFRPQYRAQSWATYIPFLNALYLAAAETS